MNRGQFLSTDFNKEQLKTNKLVCINLIWSLVIIFDYLVINAADNLQKKLECFTPHEFLLETEVRCLENSITNQPM